VRQEESGRLSARRLLICVDAGYGAASTGTPLRGRRFDCRIFFRNRNALGVTSTNSSSVMNSIAC